MGFRRALSLAYLILSCSYFLIGSIGAPWFAPVRNAVPLVVLVTFLLMLPALGVALVKPCVVGTTARCFEGKCPLHRLLDLLHAGEYRRRGGAVCRLLRAPAHERGERVSRGRPQRVCRCSSRCCCFSRSHAAPVRARRLLWAQAGRNFLTVLSNPRFMLFLLIFSGYWIVFWQEFIILAALHSRLHQS